MRSFLQVATETIHVSYGSESIVALAESIERVKGEDAMQPVSVVAASSIAAFRARQQLLRRGHAIANVDFTTLHRLAGRLGEARAVSSGKIPRTALFASEALRVALRKVESPFLVNGANAAMERALESTLRDLLSVEDEELDAISNFGERTEYVVAVTREYKRLVSQTFDVHELVQEAAREIVTRSSPDELGHVILYLPTRLPRIFRPLLDALADVGRLSIVLGTTGDEETDACMLEMSEDLTARTGAEPRASSELVAASKRQLPIPGRIVTVQDAEEEVRWVARDIFARCREGKNFADIAVLFPSGTVYPRLVADIFDVSGIPVWARQVRTLLHTSAGNALAGLLRVAHGGYRRDDLIQWLKRNRVANPEGSSSYSISRWDLLSRRAGIIGGEDEWRERLARYARQVRSRAERGAPEEPRTRKLLRESREAESLAEFVAGVVRRTAPLLEKGVSWEGLARCASDLVHVYSSPGDDVTERQAVEVVAERLSSLADLDQLGDFVDLPLFIETVEDFLEAPAPSHSERRGVFVDTIARGAGSHFDIVYVVGMTEAQIPSRPVEDRLLTDSERIRSGGSLPLSRDQAVDQRRDYLAVLDAADEVTLVHSCTDTRKGREVMPSRWLVEAANTLAGGGDIYGSDLVGPESLGPWHHRVRSFTEALAAGEVGSPQEHNLSLLIRHSGNDGVSRLLAVEPSVERGAHVYRARFSDRHDEFTGLVGRHPELDLGGGEPISTTSIETWATCPYKYFLSRVLRVETVDTPEETDEITPVDYGSLVHDILEAIVHDYDGLLPSNWTSDHMKRAFDVAEAVMVDYEESGAVGRELLWEIRKGQLIRSLPRILDADAAIRRAIGTAETFAEYEFGGTDANRPTADISLANGRTIRFRGKVDRVDVTGAGKQVAVFDYKTGQIRDEANFHEVELKEDLQLRPGSRELGSRELNADVTLGGTKLQLSVYARAVQEQLKADNCAAFYWFIPRDGLHPRIFGYNLDEFARSRFDEVLTKIDEGISGGVFPIDPGDEAGYLGSEGENCSWCDYDAVCPTGRLDLFARKATDPAIEPFMTLREGWTSDE